MNNKDLYVKILQAGLMKREDLDKCMKDLSTDPKFTKNRSLKFVIVSHGYLTSKQIDEIIIEHEPDRKPLKLYSSIATDDHEAQSEPNIQSESQQKVITDSDDFTPVNDVQTLLNIGNNKKTPESNKVNEIPVNDFNFEEYRIKTSSQNLNNNGTDEFSIEKLIKNRINNDKYKILKQLGEGGMGLILVAEEGDIKRQLAFKVMKNHLETSNNSLIRFIDEAQITGQLEHPNIVPVHELGIDSENRLAFTMKLVKGQSLKDIINKEVSGGKKLTLIEKLNIFMKICDALAFAHSKQVIHRDLKPDNIMIGEFGEVLVMDWGLAKVIGHSNPADEEIIKTVREDVNKPDLTVDGAYIGTPAYMSPEQAEGEIQEIDIQSDIFSLSAILYNMMTLKLPYEGKTVTEILLKASLGEIIQPRKRVSDKSSVPQEINAIIIKAMSFEKQNRYESVKELKKDIEAYLANEKVAAYKDNLREMLIKWSKRNPSKAMSSVVAVFFVLIIGIIVSILLSQIEAGKFREAKLAQEKAEEKAKNEKKEFELIEEKRKGLLKEGKIDELKTDLGLKLSYTREKAADDFNRLWKEHQSKGLSFSEFINTISHKKAYEYIVAYDRILSMSKKHNKKYYNKNDFFSLGLLYSVVDNKQKAIEYYEKLIDLEPDNAQVHNNLGLIYKDANILAKAEYHFEQSIKSKQLTEGYVNLGELLISISNYEKAEKILIEGIAKHPKESDLRGVLGHLYFKTNRFDEAIVEFKNGLKLNPKCGSHHCYLGLINYQLKRNEQAKTSFLNAIKYSSDNVEFRNEYGEFLLNQENFDEAKQVFLEAINIDKNNALVHNNLGEALFGLKKFKEAEEAYKKAILLEPNNAIFHRNLGELYFNQQRHSEAEDHYKISIKLNPENPLNHLRLCILYIYLENHDLTEKSLQGALFYCPEHPKLLYLLGSFYYNQRRFDEAEKKLRESIDFDPQFFEPHYTLAKVLSENAKLEEAEKEFNEALALNSSEAKIYDHYGKLLLKQKRYKDAEKQFREAIMQETNSPIYHDNLGVALHSQQRYDEAEKEYRLAIKFDPKYCNAYLNLGILLYDTNKTKDAIEILKTAVKLDYNNAKTHTYLGNCFLALNILDEAEKEHRIVVKLTPKDPNAHFCLGLTLFLALKYVDSKIEYDEAIKLDQNYWLAYSCRGALNFVNNFYAEALLDFEKALSINKNLKNDNQFMNMMNESKEALKK